MSRHIDEVEDECGGIDPVIAEGVASELGRRMEMPLGADRTRLDGRREQRQHVVSRFLEVASKFLGACNLPAALSFVLQDLVPYPHKVPLFESYWAADALRVDESPVRRPEVGSDDLTVDQRHSRVLAGDERIACDDERLPGAAPDRHRLVADLDVSALLHPIGDQEIVSGRLGRWLQRSGKERKKNG